MDTKSQEVVIEKDLKDRMKNVKQWFHKVGTDKEKKDFIFEFINKLITSTDTRPRVVIFFNDKKNLEAVNQEIQKDERFSQFAEQFCVLHGEMEVKQRKDVRYKFDECKYNFLLTTNLVARGIDFYEVTSVINCDIPIELSKRRNQNDPITADQLDVQTYIHRVGRAGRSNKKGVAISISSQDGEEAIISKAAVLDVTIHKYTDFEEIKNHLNDCYKHNKEQNLKQIQLLSDKQWADIGISKEFADHLVSKSFMFPKPSQVVSVPKIISFKPNEDKFYQHISVYGFANGRGKTLCFLTPMIEKFVSQPKMIRPWQPQAIIIAHTKDLCMQIGKQITQIMPPSKNYEISYLFKDTDTKDIKGSICIGTPGYIVKILNGIKTDKLKFLIIDEADEVLDNNPKDLKEVMAKIYEDISEGFQFLLFSATFEESDYKNLEEIVDDGDFKRNDINIESHFDL